MTASRLPGDRDLPATRPQGAGSCQPVFAAWHCRRAAELAVSLQITHSCLAGTEQEEEKNGLGGLIPPEMGLLAGLRTAAPRAAAGSVAACENKQI